MAPSGFTPALRFEEDRRPRSVHIRCDGADAKLIRSDGGWRPPHRIVFGLSARVGGSLLTSHAHSHPRDARARRTRVCAHPPNTTPPMSGEPAPKRLRRDRWGEGVGPAKVPGADAPVPVASSIAPPPGMGFGDPGAGRGLHSSTSRLNLSGF